MKQQNYCVIYSLLQNLIVSNKEDLDWIWKFEGVKNRILLFWLQVACLHSENYKLLVTLNHETLPIRWEYKPEHS